MSRGRIGRTVDIKPVHLGSKLNVHFPLLVGGVGLLSHVVFKLGSL